MMLRTSYAMTLKTRTYLCPWSPELARDMIKHVCGPETSMSCVNTVSQLKQLVYAGTALTPVGSLKWQ